MLDMSKKEKCYSLFGLLLGDGYLENNKRIVCKHTNKQREYVKWLVKIFYYWKIFQRSKFDFENKTTFGNFIYSEAVCNIPSDIHFIKFNRFYNESGKKIISEYVLKRITPLGLLFWFLDDGSLNIHKKEKKYGAFSISRCAYLSTEGYDEQSKKNIQKIFKERFNIETKIHKAKNGQTRTYINATNFRKFYDIVKPYLKIIPEDMRYKFNMKYKKNRLNNSLYLAENYNGY